ncbi:hypothetical protein L3X38_013661 [Prunus dulcis]|uniref:Uncharacterized protein n=1 Tax=Prunus dulcis TaxID=3755 RepID=A0AAD4WNC9_PRUDU|nr:hypothetical protein L3X38_013661 [Prunus dulcis]
MQVEHQRAYGGIMGHPKKPTPVTSSAEQVPSSSSYSIPHFFGGIAGGAQKNFWVFQTKLVAFAWLNSTIQRTRSALFATSKRMAREGELQLLHLLIDLFALKPCGRNASSPPHLWLSVEEEVHF